MNGPTTSRQRNMKLTAYFGEHDRVGGRLLADVLLDRFSASDVSASVLLRGILGYGAKHALRSDQLLSLSDDLPAIAIAVDRPAVIEPLAAELRALHAPGLVTLEAASRLDPRRQRTLRPPASLATAPTAIPAAAATTAPATISATAPATIPPAPAGVLTLYIGRGSRLADARRREPLHVTVCRELHERELAGATVLLGVDGTIHGQRTRARLFAHNSDVPAVVVSIGERAALQPAFDTVRTLPGVQVATLTDVTVCKRDGQQLSPVPNHASGLLKLTLHCSEAARHGRHPLHRAVLTQWRRIGLPGATTLRGVWGFHGSHAPHGDRLMQLHRHVPTVTICVGDEAQIAAAFAALDPYTEQHGLVTVEPVAALR